VRARGRRSSVHAPGAVASQMPAVAPPAGAAAARQGSRTTVSTAQLAAGSATSPQVTSRGDQLPFSTVDAAEVSPYLTSAPGPPLGQGGVHRLAYPAGRPAVHGRARGLDRRRSALVARRPHLAPRRDGPSRRDPDAPAPGWRASERPIRRDCLNMTLFALAYDSLLNRSIPMLFGVALMSPTGMCRYWWWRSMTTCVVGPIRTGAAAPVANGTTPLGVGQEGRCRSTPP
jgi:hypothetical protein